MVFETLGTFATLSEIFVGVQACVVTVIPGKLDRIKSNGTKFCRSDAVRDSSWRKPFLPCPFVYTLGAWAGLSQSFDGVN